LPLGGRFQLPVRQNPNLHRHEITPAKEQVMGTQHEQTVNT